MSIEFKIIPPVSSFENIKDLSFCINNLPDNKKLRISFHNLTNNRFPKILRATNSSIKENYIYVDNSNKIEGNFDILVDDSDYNTSFSIYAKIEILEDEIYENLEIIGFLFNILNKEISNDIKIFVDKDFLQKNESCNIKIQAKSKEKRSIIINGKKYIVFCDTNGLGSITIRAEDIFNSQLEVTQKYQILFINNNDIISPSRYLFTFYTSRN